MQIKYKNYELTLRSECGKMKVIAISLNGEELENGTPTTSETLESAIQWIEEDIRCRREEPDIYYLEEGDELFCDAVDVVVGKNDILCFNGYRDDTNYYYDGHEVDFNADGKPYIER